MISENECDAKGSQPQQTHLLLRSDAVISYNANVHDFRIWCK